MKKVVLINSYSDKNKGDLGIILGTIQTLKESDLNCEISAISSFSERDVFFKTEHEELKKYVKRIVPSLVGRVHNKTTIGKIITVCIDYLKMYYISYAPLVLLKGYLYLFHRGTLSEIQSADVVISKGGSFLCNRDTYLDKIKLDRELTIFKLCLRFNKKIIIWGQSIGPVYGEKSINNLRKVLQKIKLIIIREELCLKEYTEVFMDLKNVVLGHDLAFSLNYNNEKINKVILKGGKLEVGLTLKKFNDSKSNYKYLKLIKKIILYLNENYECNFHFVPHVTIDDDLDQVKELITLLPESINKESVFIDENDYSINNLLDIYNKKDIVIGTRLHSTIFTLITNTRVINIGYHGTKAQGVFKDINLEGNQFNIDDPLCEIISAINNTLNDEFDFSKKLLNIRNENLSVCDNILNL